MGNLLDNPRTEKLDRDELLSTGTGLSAGAAGMQGWRLEMEDTHVVKEMPDKTDHLFVAVFDGHGGAGAAEYAASNLIDVIKSTVQWRQYVVEGATNVDLLGTALKQAFLRIDNDLKLHQITNRSDQSGCTAVCAIITPDHIICSNAGDSRCVLGTNGRTIPLSVDHKPYDEGERRRIESAGGCVQWRRVDGDLAVSRALGDFQYKTRPDLPPEQQKVSCFPDIEVHRRTPQDEFLIVACDGVWDVLTSEEAVSVMREILTSGETSTLKCAEEMIDVAHSKGSRDNISVAMVVLPGASIGPIENGGVDELRAIRARAAAETDEKN